MDHAPGMEDLLAAGRLSELYAPAARYLRPRLRRLLAARFLPGSLLDDAIQDTFVRVVRYHTGYRAGLASARTWLMVLARSAVADLARRHAHKARSLFGRDGGLLFDVAANGAPAEPGRALAAVEEALAAMSPAHREAVRLRLEGASQKEAGTRLGLKAGNVGVIYHHFRRRVEALLGR